MKFIDYCKVGVFVMCLYIMIVYNYEIGSSLGILRPTALEEHQIIGKWSSYDNIDDIEFYGNGILITNYDIKHVESTRGTYNFINKDYIQIEFPRTKTLYKIVFSGNMIILTEQNGNTKIYNRVPS
jgi:hypothetical protein